MTREERLQKAEELLLDAEKIVSLTKVMNAADRAGLLAGLAAEWIALGDATTVNE